MVVNSQEARLRAERVESVERARQYGRKSQNGFSRVSENQKMAIVQNALAEFAQHTSTGEEAQEVTEFVARTLDCLQWGNSYVIFVNLDWHDFSGHLHPVQEAFIASRFTRVVTVEYFNPELSVNAASVPLLGNVAYWLWSRKYYQDSDRIRYAKALERACVKYRKPVAVPDIAHNTNYAFNFYLCYLVSFVAGGASLLNLLPDHRAAFLLASFFLYHRLDTGLRRVGKKLGKKLSLGGAFDPEHVHWYEKFFLDLEDGRRVVGASGIRQLLCEYASKERKTPGYILVNMPPAHGIRYASTLLDSTRVDVWARRIKQVVYGLIPNISPSVRTWTYKRGIRQTVPDQGNASPGAWVLMSKRRITFL